MGQTRRRDAVETPIARDLRKLGYTVIFVSGRGAPDAIIISPQRQCRVGEFKGKRGKLTAAQVASGAGVLWPVWTSLQDVLDTFELRECR